MPTLWEKKEKAQPATNRWIDKPNLESDLEDRETSMSRAMPKAWLLKPKGNETKRKIRPHSVPKNKRSCRGKRTRGVFLCRRTMRIDIESEVIPVGFLEIEGRRMLIATVAWRKRSGR